MEDMHLRTETADDYQRVFDLNYRAFGNREDESRLIERIRESADFIPELSIVAVEDEMVIGHILLSGAKVTDGTAAHNVIALAPIAVHPDYQGKGVGGRLIEEGLSRCKALGYGLVLLIGHPSYYPKFGFTPARAFGLELKQFEVPDEVFQVYELQEGQLGDIKGELRYPEAFF
jgi:putative acetyltransferase